MLKFKPVFAKSSLQSRWQSSAQYMSSRTTDHIERTTTVDAMEIEIFTRLAKTWWDPNGMVKGLHTYNKIRVPYFIGDWLSCPKTLASGNTKILDVGCGGGLLSEDLAKSGVTVTGIDVTEDMIALATHHAKTNQELIIKPTYYLTSIEEHAKKHQNYYDRVIASEVIDHVVNKELFVKACVQVLKPGGTIFFSCPNKTILSYLINIAFGEYVVNNPPKGTHHYHKFISSQDLGLMLENNGCKVEETRGLFYNMLTNTWKWSSLESFYAIRAVKVKS